MTNQMIVKPPSTSWHSPSMRGQVLSSFFKGGSLANAKQVGLFIIFLFTIYLLRSKTSLAQTFDSASYHIDFGNFNMTSGRKTSTNYTLTDTVGQNAPGQYDASGYTIKAGFQYLYDKRIPLSFKINNLDLNFGVLTPNVGSTVSNIITINISSHFFNNLTMHFSG